ncbi:type VI secretion system membrane subunit TssM [Pendulispora albinea]|uniref:Type VI secretion system membrane subunit TssM n=1 Tax=Pendulispora albinea TaxID=2741071 RepID=A0ABZ2LNN7_9BACT
MILGITIALSVAAIIAIWVIGWFFTVTLVVKIVLTVAVLAIGGLFLGLILYLRYTAARDLEQAMLQQGQAQIASTRPDRREAVMELQGKMQQAILTLKRSKLGARGGAKALYELPWYIIVGPPGAGKTTAIKHSDLGFPLADQQSASAYRGVGGTRNCDWWFTNDAILLDTAGRYATDVNDQDEWLMFLDLLKKHRPSRPINGLIVAISLADLAVSQDQGIDEVARRIRARVDEIATRINMLVPIYVLLTKCDLVQGFVEFWGDLRKSERGQIWGMSFPLNANNANEEPRAAFEREFALLAKALHGRALRRFRGERHLEMRQKIAEFPLEFTPLRHHIGVFLQALFQKNRFQETPILRGVYFTSGTQMGTPTSRVVNAMAQAFGLRGLGAAFGGRAATESKSYFLTEVFKSVMFKDQHVAGRTEVDRQRRLLTRGAFALAATLLGGSLLLPAFFTFVRNRELVQTTHDIAARVQGVRWGEGTSLQEGAPHLDAAQARLKQLDAWENGAPPLQLRWGMYTGDELDDGMRSLYGAVLARAAVARAHAEIESRLKTMDAGPVRTSENFNKDFDTLKLYLMMSDPKHMDPEWASPRLVREWSLTAHTRVTNEEELLLPHVAYYFELLKRGGIKPWGQDARLVATARSVLAQVPQVERLYESLVRDANMELAPIRRETIFYGSIAPFVQSRRGVRVDGAYTKAGWLRVRDLLGTERAKLAAEKWVLQDEGDPGSENNAIVKLRELYFERYKNAWRDFLADLQIQDPGNTELALDELSALSEPEWPYLRLMRVLRDNVNLDMSEPDTSADAGLIDKLKEAAQGKAAERANKIVDGGLGQGQAAPKKAGPSPVELAFKPMVRFGLPAGEPKEGEPAAPTGLSQYQAQLARLVATLTELRDAEANADPRQTTAVFTDAARATAALLTEQDGFTRPLLSPLLLNPINITANSVTVGASGVIQAQWETQVWSKWHDKLEGKYPFTNSGADAPLPDFIDFFRQGDGVLWSFYDATLRPTLDRSGNRFSPSRRARSAVPYMPEFLSNCLSRGADITETVFPPKADGAVVAFDVNLHSVSERIAEVVLEVEGQTRTYRNEPERWLTVTWPGKGAHGAKLKVRGEGLNEEIGRQGDFGLFRLLDAADVRAGTANERPVLIATFEIRGTRPPAQVKLDIKPSREQNPLTSGFFRGYSCPRVSAGR